MSRPNTLPIRLAHASGKLYEHTRVVITTNLDFAEWSTVFGDAKMFSIVTTMRSPELASGTWLSNPGKLKSVMACRQNKLCEEPSLCQQEPAGHAFIAPSFGNACGTNGAPYINHCPSKVKGQAYYQPKECWRPFQIDQPVIS